MKRLQISLEPELDAALGRAARRERMSKAALVRRVLRDRLRTLPPIEDDPLWRLVGIAEGTPANSVSVDDVVYGPKSGE